MSNQREVTETGRTAFGPLSLEGLSRRLDGAPQDAEVYFDFCGLMPVEPTSYRGFYDHLAFGYRSEGPAPKVREVRQWLEDALGKEYQGYKGGCYRMYAETPLWVAKRGQCEGTGVRGVRVVGSHMVILKTKYFEV